MHGGKKDTERLERRKLPRIKDVADRAGVSSASVSRVLNTPSKVSLDLRRRVEAAMAELSFVPNWAAQALASQRSRTVGVVVPTLGTAIFAAGVEALQARLGEWGHSLLIASSNYDKSQELAQVRVLIERKVDGLILVGVDHESKVAELLSRADIPAVSTYSFDPLSHFSTVGIDNGKAAYRMARYLWDTGHRSFGIITSPVSANDRTRSRRNGFLKCFDEQGVNRGAVRIAEVPYTIADGRRALRELVQGAKPPTAVLCTTDVLAIGSLLEASLLGIRIPEDLSVTGFDDLELAAQLIPALTTIKMPALEIGRRAADALLSMMQNEQDVLHIELEAELILRQSTTAPPKSEDPSSID